MSIEICDKCLKKKKYYYLNFKTPIIVLNKNNCDNCGEFKRLHRFTKDKIK